MADELQTKKKKKERGTLERCQSKVYNITDIINGWMALQESHIGLALNSHSSKSIFSMLTHYKDCIISNTIPNLRGAKRSFLNNELEFVLNISQNKNTHELIYNLHPSMIQ